MKIRMRDHENNSALVGATVGGGNDCKIVGVNVQEDEVDILTVVASIGTIEKCNIEATFS